MKTPSHEETQMLRITSASDVIAWCLFTTATAIILYGLCILFWLATP